MGRLFRGSGGGAHSRWKLMGVWGRIPQPSEPGGKVPAAGGKESGGGAPGLGDFSTITHF